MSNDRFFDHGPVYLKDVRLDYNDLFVPKAPKDKPNQEPKYRLKAIIYRGTDAEKVAKEAILAAAKKAWGDNAANVFRALGKNEKAVRNGDDYLDNNGAKRPEYDGNLFISASNKAKPAVVGPKKVNNKFVTIHADGQCSIEGVVQDPPPYKITVPYRGCRVNLKVTFVAMKGGQMPSGEKVSNQVYAKIEAVQFLRDDAPFGAGAASAEGFDDEEVADGDLFDNAPSKKTGFEDDDIPF